MRLLLEVLADTEMSGSTVKPSFLGNIMCSFERRDKRMTKHEFDMGKASIKMFMT